MTQKKLTVPFLTLRPGEYSSVSDAATAIIRYNLLLNRLEVSLDSSPYAPFGAGGDGYLYDQLVAAPQVEPLLDGYIAYVDGYSTELNKVSVEDILSLGVGGGVASVGASSPLASSGGVNPVISFPTWPANASGALSNDGYGNLSWSSSPGGGISGTIAATQIAFGTGTDTLGGESGLTWDTAQKLARVSNSGNYTDLLSTGVFAKAAGVGSNEVEISIDDGSGLPVITALNGATGGIVDLAPGSIRFREQSAAPAPSPFLIDVDSNTLELGTVDASSVEIGSGSAAVTISGAFTLPVADGANGEVLTTDGAGAVSWAAVPSTPPGGPADSVQINDGYGGFIGYSGLTWDNSQSTLTAPVLALAEGTAPAGTSAHGKLWANSSANARPYWTDETGQTYNLTLDRFNTLAPAATVVIDASPDLPVFNSLSVDQDTTFTTANLGPGRSASVRVVCDGTTRSLTFPTGPGGWTWLGSGPPSSLAANDVGYLSITAYGATDADVVAAWSYENMPAVVTGSGASNRVAFWSSTTDLASDADLTYDSTTNALTVGTVLGVRRTGPSDTGFALAGAGDSDTGIVFNQWGVGANTLSIYANGSQAAYFTQTRLVSGALGGANLFMGTGTPALPQYSGTGDTATGFFIQTVAGVSASGVARQTWSTTGSVINDDGNNFDFRVESQGNANMLFVDASANAVGIGTGTPSALLSVGASSQFQVDSSGNLARINNIPYTFPSAQGAAGTILTNDGYGALSWAENAAQATSAPISTKSSNYTMTTADGTVLVDATSGDITITLPAAASATESIFTIKKKDVTFHTVTVAAAGSELIDGAAIYILSTQYEAIKIQSDGSAWWII